MKKIITLGLVCSLAACATSIQELSVSETRTVATKLPPMSYGQGQLCISRVGDAYTCDKGLKFDFIDNYERIIGDIRTGNEYFCVNLTPGNHNISGNAKSSVYYAGAALPTESRVGEDINIIAGRRTFMEVQCTNWGSGVQFVPVSQTRGLTGIYNTNKYQKRYGK